MLCFGLAFCADMLALSFCLAVGSQLYLLSPLLVGLYIKINDLWKKGLVLRFS